MGRHGCAEAIVTEPGEWRLMEEMRQGPGTRMLDDDRFLADRHGFAGWAQTRLKPGGDTRMEQFYRLMRRKTGLLMEDGQPAGGQWNYDADNRRPAPGPWACRSQCGSSPTPSRARFWIWSPPVFPTISAIWNPSGLPRPALKRRPPSPISCARPAGIRPYQDAMLWGHRFLHHAVISPYLNAGLLDPLEMCRQVEAEWRAGRVPLASAEGFIRQIIGWREFVRGIYWWQGPDYARSNALDAHRPLPWFYWTGETDMACLRACITQTREEAYAHHIQRLMVTGNFALLAGVDPHALHEWYLAVYADAFEWVELPNTVGMSQFADGGLLASKPYVASGAYIDRMSDYCGGCRYDVRAKSGARACPFNLLYWHFIARHAARLRDNPRMARVVQAWETLPLARQAELRDDAECFLATLA
jgi:deoxyribodipyrimidine photolyase-related protein